MARVRPPGEFGWQRALCIADYTTPSRLAESSFYLLEGQIGHRSHVFSLPGDNVWVDAFRRFGMDDAWRQLLRIAPSR